MESNCQRKLIKSNVKEDNEDEEKLFTARNLTGAMWHEWY